MKVPFLSLKSQNQPFEKEFIFAFQDFLEKGQYILGENVKSFEIEFAKYCNSNHCIGVANGLDALILILEGLNLSKDAEIIVPANTYFASILAILRAGLKPVLVEPSIDNYLIDVNQIITKITSKTKGILAVNLYGKMCDYKQLSEICKGYNLNLIVDAAQSHGATFLDSRKCSGAIATAYSFYPTKNLGALADAGAVVTDDYELAKNIEKNRNYGSEIKYKFDSLGHNSRLSELQAIFLNLKLKCLEDEICKRRKIADFYLKNINNTKIILPPSDTTFEDSWHLFVIRVENREPFLNHLKKNNVGYEIHYPIPPHKQKALKEFSELKLPITEKIHETILSLPLNSSLTTEQINHIINTVNAY